MKRFFSTLKHLSQSINRKIHPFQNEKPQSVSIFILKFLYVLLYSNSKPTSLKFLTVATGLYLFGFTFSMGKLYFTFHEKEREQIMLQLGAVSTYMVLFVVVGLTIYTKQTILEFGLVNQNYMRVVNSKFGFWHEERILPIKSVKTTKKSMDFLENQKNYSQSSFHLLIEDRKIPYMCNVKSLNSYMDVENVKLHFTQNNLIQNEENKPDL